MVGWNIEKNHVEIDLGQWMDVPNVMKWGWFESLESQKAHEFEVHWDGVEEANSLEKWSAMAYV